MPLIFFVPLGILGSESLHAGAGGGLTSANYAAFFYGWRHAFHIFWRTVRLSLLITAACILFGYPLALFMRRAGRPAARGPHHRHLAAAHQRRVRNVAWLLVLGREAW